jgi:ANTAR domain
MTAPALHEIAYPMHDPLRPSYASLALSGLMLFAMQAAGAEGYSWCEVDSAMGALVERYSSGISVPRWAVLDGASDGASGVTSREGVTVIRYPLHAEGNLTGLLAFAFRRNVVQEEEVAILNRMAGAIETLHAVPNTTARLAARIGCLDAELAGIKIAERTRGLFANGAAGSEAVEGVVRHVESVLEGRQFGAVLQQLLPDMEERVQERKAVARAKELLQGIQGMSEEQAYMYLRYRSRTTRRRLGEVALEIIRTRTI